MKRIGYNSLAYAAVLTVVALVALATSALAVTPAVNSAVIRTRIFNDAPGSTLNTTDAYPGLIAITDAFLNSGNFANRHNWRFSENDVDPAVFNNDASFRFSATVRISGSGRGEAGLQISPWWSQDVDGQFMINPQGIGEVACFGGRLPFYSFTANHGVHYVKGTAVHMEMTYWPNGLSAASPATMEYVYEDGTGVYTSGPIPFDQGNPAEDPPYGLWGMLNDGRAGGYVQVLVSPFIPGNILTATWENIRFTPLDPTPTAQTTWGKLKALYR